MRPRWHDGDAGSVPARPCCTRTADAVHVVGLRLPAARRWPLGPMGRVVSAYDNAMMESSLSTLPRELLDRNSRWTWKELAGHLRVDRGVVTPRAAITRR